MGGGYLPIHLKKKLSWLDPEHCQVDLLGTESLLSNCHLHKEDEFKMSSLL
jgi:hypothetical protein